MTYEQALEYIHGISWTFCKPGLERIGELCEKLGHPERELQYVHVAGTNGKGSFCSMTASVLQAAGYKVGLYTSPFIRTFNERMQINGENIADDELADITALVKPFADSMQDKPTEFELITAIAFEYFRRHRCDVVVLETGLGGRLDSTNIIEAPLLSVITGIALDHTAFLGDTVEAVAKEKAGIIKAGSPVLFGGEDDTAAKVIEDTAKARGSPYRRVDYTKLKNLTADLAGSRFDYGDWQNVSIRLLGMYQPKNASVVLEAIGLLRERGLSIPDAAVYEGLQTAVWHARFEIVGQDPLTIFDGAHNPQGIEQAVKSVKRYFGDEKIYLLTAVLKDKDYTEIAAMLSTIADRAFVMTPDSPRALPANEYAAVLKNAGIPSTPFDTIEDAYTTARAAAKADGKPLVCLGSLYVYSSLCPLFEE